MITKMDKKILGILIIVLILAILAGVAVFKYLMVDLPETAQDANKVENIENTENQELPPPENTENNSNVPQVQVEGVGGGDFMICIDQCGDNVCQPAGTVCPDSLNCICAETPEECPQDCK
ncbi:MAG: hypothetical protein Q8Q48_00280 [Candidatus Staskawiczbacteria bacterium]|nr:hypothetical protein [Candidatus Staskawiczbacteria bacterium]